MNKGLRIGYARISTHDQSLLRQLEGIELDKKFEDIASGKDTDRPQLNALMDFARQGDTIIVHSLDRLARNLDDLRRLVYFFIKKGITIQFMKENLTFSGDANPMSLFLLSVMGAFAEFERAFIRERQREGIELAKKRGVYKKGRRKKLNEEQSKQIREKIAAGIPKTKVAREFKVSRMLIYQILQDFTPYASS